MNGAILWFTGLPGSGKSTLARVVGNHVGAGRRVEILDGDQMRRELSSDLGFSKSDRDANVERIGRLARQRAADGVFVIVATISPYDLARERVRSLAAADQIPFALVFLEASLDALVKRDPKGHYRRAIAGDLANFTGISDPYERPLHPDVVVNTEEDAVDVSARRLLRGLARCGFLPDGIADA